MINLNDDTRLFPQVTFRVNTIRIHDILSWPQPDGNIQNIINNLKSQTIWVPNVPYPLKHGDVFSLYGKKALIAYNEYQHTNYRKLHRIILSFWVIMRNLKKR